MTTSTLPLQDYAATRFLPGEKVPQGLDALAHRVAGAVKRRRLRFAGLREEAEVIHSDAAELAKLDRNQIAERVHAARRRMLRTTRLPVGAGDRRATMALLADVIRRATRLTPYPEQILGALVMERGALAEMATGEGKTLTIGLTAAFLAWKGSPCHVITANDYLVERDADWLRDFYGRCGLTVGAVTGTLDPPGRRKAYEADITYVTSKEVVADFLRDRIALGDWAHPARRLIQRFLHPARDPRDRTVMRGLHAAIIDEADHVLIDEAVTPLIISRPVENIPLEEASRMAAHLATGMEEGIHFDRFPRFRDVELKAAGKAVAAEASEGLPSIWTSPARAEELLRQALVAREFYKEGEQYVITSEKKIAIVDESTGRLMPERTWRQGLHQAIEAKEGLPVTLPSETLSRLSFQRYFRSYPHLCGCTGTASEAGSEFWQIYKLPVFAIPTHRPSARERLEPAFFATAGEKREAIADFVAGRHALGQPILIGTRSVSESEILAGLFKARELATEVLNATRHRHEASIVAAAGRRGAITIATNMAGRGTDIRLARDLEDLGGLLVIISEMHGSARVDRQLAGRCARQGERGQIRLFASFEDDLALRFLPRPLRALGKAGLARGLPATRALAAALLRFAQSRATAQAFRERKMVPRQDEWLSESLAFAGQDVGAQRA